MQRIWQVAAGGGAPLSSVSALRFLLLQQRAIPAEEIENFFTPVYDQVIHNPLLLSDMAKVIERVYRAIADGEQIVVYGDYDADGISSVAILMTVLRDLGAQVSPYLPHRVDDGYGLNRSVLESLQPELDLLITVDCGISNPAEIVWLAEQHVDTIVIDHHELPATLPPAYAIVHPRHPQAAYPELWLCGAGLAWKVAQGLVRDPRAQSVVDPDYEKWLLDLATLGTIADVVPLRGENRRVVQFGLEVLKRSRRPGVQALLRAMRSNLAQLSTRDIAFRVVPKINAAGRMDHPQPALELLLATDKAQADMLLGQLEGLNQQRQTLTARIMREAEKNLDLAAPLLFVENETWPAGVVGLVAGKLANRYQRPAVVVGRAGSVRVGSARSVADMHIVDILRAGEQYLAKLGGHAQAAGFSVSAGADLLAFRNLIVTAAGQVAAAVSDSTRAEAAAILPSHLIQPATVSMIDRFAPWGEGNQPPNFIVSGVVLQNYQPVGREQKHARCLLRTGQGAVPAIGFDLAPQIAAELKAGQTVDVLCQLAENEYRGHRSLQLQLLDVAPPDKVMIRT